MNVGFVLPATLADERMWKMKMIMKRTKLEVFSIMMKIKSREDLNHIEEKNWKSNITTLHFN